MSDELITVATFQTPIEAELARLRLERDGIMSFVIGSHVAGMQVFGLTVGGVRLQVRPADAARAVAVLETGDYDGDLEPLAAVENVDQTPVPYLVDEDD